MLQISHQQARRLILFILDEQTISNEQWAALHHHLEGCPDCRAYQQRWQGVQRDLRRVTHARWSAVQTEVSDLPETIVQRRRRVDSRWQALSHAAAAALVLVLVFVFLRARPELSVEQAIPVTETATPRPTPTNTPKPGTERFRGVVLYEARQGGNSEIFLLNALENAQGELPAEIQPINLTENPAEDTAPVWSPDGEWIAFLSDRTGKPEVYVMHVSGSHLVQVTDTPEIDWLGPIDWSADGQLLALPGRPVSPALTAPAEEAYHWVYLLPLQGEDQREGRPIRLDAIRKDGQLKFSPTLPLLAFESSPETSLSIVNVETGTSGVLPNLSVRDQTIQRMHIGIGGTFDWLPDGERLIYISEGPFDVESGQPAGKITGEIRTTRGDLSRNTTDFASPSFSSVVSKGKMGEYRQVTWLPLEAWTWIAYLAETAEGSGCWSLHLRQIENAGEKPLAPYDLCIEAGFGRENWLIHHSTMYMITLGRMPGERELSIWAYSSISMPLRLVNAAQLGGLMEGQPGNLLRGPHLRPTGPSLALDPQPLRAPAPSAASRPTEPLPPLLLAGEQDGQPAIQTLDPLTGERKTIITASSVFPRREGAEEQVSSRALTCPAWSPNHLRVAFLTVTSQSDDVFGYPAHSEIWTAGAQGSGLSRLLETGPPQKNENGWPPEIGSTFDCSLSWSPDGKTLAAIYRTLDQVFLALIPTEGGQARYLKAGAVNELLGWSADGKILLTYNAGARDGRITAIDPLLAVDNDQGGGVSIWLDSDGWDRVEAVGFSPDGTEIVLSTLEEQVSDTDSIYELRLVDMTDQQGRVVHRQTGPTWFGPYALKWLPGGRLSYAQREQVSRHNPYPGTLWLYDPGMEEPQVLMRSETPLYTVVWSPDGHWVAYSTDTGLWLLDVEGALKGEAGPVRLGDPALNLQWEA